MSKSKVNLATSYLAKTILASVIFVLAGCSQPKPTTASIYVFGTLVEISIYNHNETKANLAIQKVEQKFQDFHKEWHAWEKGGIVSKINDAIANNQSIEVAPSVKQFILKSQKLSAQSQGLFDPGIGGLIDLWGFHKENWQGPPPSAQQIQKWLKSAPSIADVRFNNYQLTSLNPQVQFDFGGNAKGLAIDIAMQTLKETGIDNALVSIGGDMKAIGSKNTSTNTEADPWNIGIQSPKNPSKAIAKVQLYSNESIVTSGDYQRFFEWQGQHYSHIINPKTGYPANTFSSVTVIHADATTADAAATAIMIAGPAQWKQVADSMNISYLLCIDHQGGIIQTEAMQARTTLLQ